MHTIMGVNLWESLTKCLKEIGIEHCYSYPRIPKTYKYATVYGNVERVIKIIEEELWFIEGIDYTIDHLNSLLEKHIEKYNFVRPHFSLGYIKPAEVAYKYTTVYVFTM